MDAYFSYLNGLVNTGKSKFKVFPWLKWVNGYNLADFQELRDRFLKRLGGSVIFKGTKPYYRSVSRGCQLCGEGTWSCLFITGKCNAKCFYCPASQDKDEVPVSQRLSFPSAESYAEYIKHFDFRGVSFSGGEPLLVKERVIDYLEQIRKNAPSDIYCWMYTNGILADETVFGKLGALGLNEVRFDIGATGYNLDKIRHAKGHIPVLTVEIPAIPEEKERLKKLLPELVKAGISHLNLHQLRLTEYNAPKLIGRDYTFIPAEKPIVLESELTALEIIDFALDHDIDIGINYCSFFFKNRFQACGFRKQITKYFHPHPEEITEKGFIRNLNREGISYKTLRLADKETFPGNSQSLDLKYKSYSYSNDLVYKQTFKGEGHLKQITKFLEQDPDVIPTSEDIFDLWQYEYIERGLREY